MRQPLPHFDGTSLITPELIDEASVIGRVEDMERLADARTEVALICMIAQQGFEAGRDAATTIDLLIKNMHTLCASLPREIWKELVPLVQAHPVSKFLHQDPFTAWSFEKPRGYSGDAQLLDFIYQHPDMEDAVLSASRLGRELYDYTRAAPAASAVRERRDILASLVDETASRSGTPVEILTIAAGHLREAPCTRALGEGAISRWIALDQDPLSVGLMMRDYAGTPIDAMHGSVRGLLKNTYQLGHFDLAYAAGLYDYLPRDVAVRLTRRCVELLKPGGTFLFANFCRDIDDDAYMETFMNWSLILRSEAEMRDILDASLEGTDQKGEIFFGANRNIVYATITKPA